MSNFKRVSETKFVRVPEKKTVAEVKVNKKAVARYSKWLKGDKGQVVKVYIKDGKHKRNYTANIVLIIVIIGLLILASVR